MPVNDKYWIIVLVCAVAFSLVAIEPNNQNLIEPNNPIGLAISPLYPAFSTPVSTFSAPSSITFATTDTIKALTLSVSDDAVYKTGYISIDGNSWQATTLTGTVLGGNWFKGASTGTVNILKSQIGTGNNTNNYIIIYTCTRNGTTWNCHDNKWQIKDFNTIKTETPATCTGSTTQACSITNGAGTQSRTCNNGVWSAWNTCTVTSCNTGYTKSGNTCVAASPPPTGTGNTYYVSTTGSDTNPGTINSPWRTWQKGFSSLVAGDTLYIRGGTYTGMAGKIGGGYFGVRIQGVSGTSTKHITVSAYPGEVPILDGSSLTSTTGSNIGMYFGDCNYWDIKGLTVTNFLQYSDNQYNSPGWVLVTSSNMLLDSCTVHDCGDGFGIWAGGSDNIYYKNCDAYQNHDRYIGNGDELPGGLANGFYAPLSPGQHVTYEGCRSWANSDDGWDLFKGAGTIDFINCWAFENGNGYGGVTGDGAGFKLGPTTDSATRRTLKNCIAADNIGYTQGNGFDQNTGPEWVYVPITIYNCASYNNRGVGYQFYWESSSTIRNSISYEESAGSFGSSIIKDHNSWSISGITVDSADFVSLDSSQLRGPRKADGSLPDITFLHLASGSDLIDKGVNVGLLYSGSAPDIGAFETQ